MSVGRSIRDRRGPKDGLFCDFFKRLVYIESIDQSLSKFYRAFLSQTSFQQANPHARSPIRAQLARCCEFRMELSYPRSFSAALCMRGPSVRHGDLAQESTLNDGHNEPIRRFLAPVVLEQPLELLSNKFAKTKNS